MSEQKKILVIDVDPQGNTTSGLGLDKNNIENTIYELLIGEITTDEAITKDVAKNLRLFSINEVKNIRKFFVLK